MANTQFTGIKNIFVLMLENHSFDHLLGYSGLTGTAPDGTPTSINGLGDNNSNAVTINGNVIDTMMTRGAVDPMPIDPGHEFLDIMEQLCGVGTVNPFPAGPYPPINNSGFLFNYVSRCTQTDPPNMTIGNPEMTSCNAGQVPVITQLAQEFAVCDSWFASLPGPTVPNRFFAMGASSGGLDDSPGMKQLIAWSTAGFEYPNGSIFQTIENAGLQYKLYNDRNDSFAAPQSSKPVTGKFPIVALLDEIPITDVDNFEQFQEDIAQEDYPYAFTWIEPNYGHVSNDSFSGGSSQHPMDSLDAGERLIAATYNAIRNSPHWEDSLLIVTYDEHGGFYDHVAPLGTVPPGDNPGTANNKRGFNFTWLGVRIPSVVISPMIPKGTIDHTVYDHTSILKTVEGVFRIQPLTQRDASANGLTGLLSLTEPRSDCPQNVAGLPIPSSKSDGLSLTGGDDGAWRAEPLPEQGNIYAFLAIAQKADYELSDKSPVTEAAIVAEVQTIQTRGQAHDYLQKVMAKVDAAHAAKNS